MEKDLLEQIWDQNRDYLRRMLIGLGRDIDLADDLLQETYLNARRGISGLKGENARAWLAAIAKNAFLMHIRRRYVRTETELENAEAAAESVVGTTEHLNSMNIRQALSTLDPIVRKALVMKHYGGFTYKDIAKHMNCPVGTAKWRVHSAIIALRQMLGGAEEKPMELTCNDLKGGRLLDYLYAKLPDDEMKAADEHIEKCSGCRKEANEVADVLQALDSVENEYRVTSIIELDTEGKAIVYASFVFANEHGEIAEPFEFGGSKSLQYMAIEGKEVQFESIGQSDLPDTLKYRARLPDTIVPGKPVEMLIVDYPEQRAEELGNRMWRLGPGKLDLSEELAYAAAIRLPADAEFVQGMPEPQEVRKKKATTVIWRGMLPANQKFEFWVEYRL
ncbi:RNA polymerase sigma factor [bacterium]|nr:RNA polymerase sigma factor [bacterium]